MLFNSALYLVFLPIVVCLFETVKYFVSKNKDSGR